MHLFHKRSPAVLRLSLTLILTEYNARIEYGQDVLVCVRYVRY